MRSMRTITAIALFLSSTALLFAMEITIASFTAKSDGKDITLRWESTKETQVLHYEVLRSMQNTNDYKTIATVAAKGSSSYTFIDEDAYMKGNGGTTTNGTLYSYRLRIVGDSGTTLSDPISVTHNVSSVRRTWGMIKEMFR